MALQPLLHSGQLLLRPFSLFKLSHQIAFKERFPLL